MCCCNCTGAVVVVCFFFTKFSVKCNSRVNYCVRKHLNERFNLGYLVCVDEHVRFEVSAWDIYTWSEAKVKMCVCVITILVQRCVSLTYCWRHPSIDVSLIAKCSWSLRFFFSPSTGLNIARPCVWRWRTSSLSQVTHNAAEGKTAIVNPAREKKSWKASERDEIYPKAFQAVWLFPVPWSLSHRGDVLDFVLIWFHNYCTFFGGKQ